MSDSCSQCQEFCTRPGVNLCSMCSARKEYDAAGIEIKDAFSKTVCGNARFDRIFFKLHKNNWPQLFSMIRSPYQIATEAHIRAILSEVPRDGVAELAMWLQGFREIPPVVFTAEQANRLLFHFYKDSLFGDNWVMAHLIGSHIGDFWNITFEVITNAPLVICYYDQNISNQNDVKWSQVLAKWFRRFLLSSSHIYLYLKAYPDETWQKKLQSVVVQDCCVCCEPIWATDRTAKRCIVCRDVVHGSCFINNSCPKCRTQYLILPPVRPRQT